MKRVILAALMCVVFAANATTARATNGVDWVELSSDKCSNQTILDKLTPRFREMMKAGKAYVAADRKTYDVCWIVDGESAHLLYEDGDQGLIPLEDFKVSK